MHLCVYLLLDSTIQVLAYGGYLDFSLQFDAIPGYARFTLIEDVPLVIIQVRLFGCFNLIKEIHLHHHLKLVLHGSGTNSYQLFT